MADDTLTHDECADIMASRPNCGPRDEFDRDLAMIMRSAGISSLGDLGIKRPTNERTKMPEPGTLEARGLPDTEFGQAMLKKLEAAGSFYKEYVTSDHDHEHVARITQATALAMLQLSPYRPFLSSYMIGYEAAEDVTVPPAYLMNKGAVRLTIAPEHAELPCWTEEQLEEGLRHSSRDDLWLYNHDGRFSLTRPRREKRS